MLCMRTDGFVFYSIRSLFFSPFASEARAAASTDAGKKLHSRFVSAVGMLTG